MRKIELTLEEYLDLKKKEYVLQLADEYGFEGSTMCQMVDYILKRDGWPRYIVQLIHEIREETGENHYARPNKS